MEIEEGTLRDVLDWAVLGIEAAGALVILVGAIVAVVRWARIGLGPRTSPDLVPVRLDLGRQLVLGLEFLVAADIVASAVDPTFEELGLLAGVVAVRTVLSFLLRREIREEQEMVEARSARA